jgi:4'-phosphopantetheinyl transferase EntD
MIDRLVPAYVVCVESEGDDPTARLLPAEAAQLGRAIEAKVREYGTARVCARQALARLGVHQQALLKGKNREPLWPPGYVGSITHCDGYRGAAVASCRDALTIGIDAEPHEPLPTDLLAIVTVPAERAWLERAPPGVHWDRLLFSAKESIYKAWFPVTHKWLGFEEACVTIDPAAGVFRAELSRMGRQPDERSLARLDGRFVVAGRLIFTAITVDR